MEIKGRHLIEGVPKTITITRRGDPRGAGRDGQRHRRRGARRARAHAAGAVGRHRRSRHRADRRRLAAEEPRQAAARGDRAAAWRWPRTRCPRSCSARARCCRISTCSGRSRSTDAGPPGPPIRPWPRRHPAAQRLPLPGRRARARPARSPPRSTRAAACRCSKQVTFGVFAEVQRAAASVVSGVRDIWGRLRRAARTCAPRTSSCSRRLAEAEVQLQEQRALADQTRGLERLLDLRDRSTCRRPAAEVIAAGATPDFRTMTIDKGTGRRAAAGHGGHRAGRRRRARGRAERARGEGAAADRPERRRRRASSSARARRGSPSGRADDQLRARVRVGPGRRERGRPRRHLGHRRHLTRRAS